MIARFEQGAAPLLKVAATFILRSALVCILYRVVLIACVFIRSSKSAACCRRWTAGEFTAGPHFMLFLCAFMLFVCYHNRTPRDGSPRVGSERLRLWSHHRSRSMDLAESYTSLLERVHDVCMQMRKDGFGELEPAPAPGKKMVLARAGAFAHSAWTSSLSSSPRPATEGAAAASGGVSPGRGGCSRDGAGAELTAAGPQP